MVRILGCDEVLYTGLAYRNRAAATASSFGVAANVKLVLARRVQRALVRQDVSHPYRCVRLNNSGNIAIVFKLFKSNRGAGADIGTVVNDVRFWGQSGHPVRSTHVCF
jgi:hypothetical protein